MVFRLFYADRTSRYTSRYVQTSLPMNIIKLYMNIINYPYYEYHYGHCASIGSMFCASRQQGSSVGHE